MPNAFQSMLLVIVLVFTGSFASDTDVQLYTFLSNPDIEIFSTPSHGTVDYQTNQELGVGLEARYQRFGLAVSPSFFGESQESKVNPPTHYYDLSAFYFGDEWGAETYYQYYRGFYANLENGATLNAPDLSLYGYDLNIYHSINQNSRVNRITDGLASNGIKWNFYSLFSVAFLNLQSPQPLFQNSDSTDDAELDDVTRFQMLQITAGAGATLNTSLFGFYADPTLFIGYGPQFRWTNVDVDKVGVGIKANFKFDCGYQSKKFALGMAVQDDGNDARAGDEHILFHSLFVKFLLTLFL